MSKQSPRILRAPSSNDIALANFERGVLSGLEIEELKEYDINTQEYSESNSFEDSNESQISVIEEIEACYSQFEFGRPDKLRLWGTTQQSERYDIHTGDILLFYLGDQHYDFAAVVYDGIISEELASNIWESGKEKAAKNWDRIMILSEPVPVDLPGEMIADFGNYKVNWAMNFSPLNDQGHKRIENLFDPSDIEHGPVAEFLMARSFIEESESADRSKVIESIGDIERELAFESPSSIEKREHEPDDQTPITEIAQSDTEKLEKMIARFQQALSEIQFPQESFGEQISDQMAAIFDELDISAPAIDPVGLLFSTTRPTWFDQLARTLQRDGQAILIGPPSHTDQESIDAFLSWVQQSQSLPLANISSKKTHQLSYATDYEEMIEKSEMSGDERLIRDGKLKQFVRRADAAHAEAHYDNTVPDEFLYVLRGVTKHDPDPIFRNCINVFQRGRRESSKTKSEESRPVVTSLPASGEQLRVPQNFFMLFVGNGEGSVPLSLMRRCEVISIPPNENWWQSFVASDDFVQILSSKYTEESVEEIRAVFNTVQNLNSRIKKSDRLSEDLLLSHIPIMKTIGEDLVSMESDGAKLTQALETTLQIDILPYLLEGELTMSELLEELELNEEYDLNSGYSNSVSRTFAKDLILSLGCDD